jgi:hypothetical protein
MFSLTLLVVDNMERWRLERTGGGARSQERQALRPRGHSLSTFANGLFKGPPQPHHYSALEDACVLHDGFSLEANLTLRIEAAVAQVIIDRLLKPLKGAPGKILFDY